MANGIRRKLLRETLASGGAVVGGWSMLGTPFAAEVLAGQRFDYVVVDCQHGLAGYDRMTDVLGVIGRMRPTPLVRVPSLDGGWVGRALDAGAEGVIVPMVNCRADAEAAAAACRFPPFGVRSYGPIRSRRELGYEPKQMSDGVICFVMVETEAALLALDDICSVPGIDGIYIGPADLSVSLGLEPAGNGDGRFAQALDNVLAACAKRGLVAGIHATSGEQARAYFDRGFRFVTAVSDIDALRRGAGRELSSAVGTATSSRAVESVD